MTRDEHRRVNYELCTSVDLTSLGVALDRMICHGMPALTAGQFRTLAASLLALLRGENDRLLSAAVETGSEGRES